VNLEEAVVRLRPLMYHVARRMRPGDVEAAVADMTTLVWRLSVKYPGRTWGEFRKIASRAFVNVSTDAIRRTKRLADGERPINEARSLHAPGRDETARIFLDEVSARLGPKDREVLAWARKGYRQCDIAEKLGVTAPQISRRWATIEATIRGLAR